MQNLIKLSYILFILLFSSLCFSQSNEKSITIGKSSLIHSKILKEDRILNIYIPDDYNLNDSIKYPVIYILDGGIDEDFVHILGIVRFNTQPWIARFPQSIVVGIENNNRRRDFTFAVNNTDFIEKEGFSKASFPQYGGSDNYMNFLENEVKPFIATNYRINNESTIIGESLAGLLTTEILLKRPYLFNNYLIISPSLWWGEQELLNKTKSLLQDNLSQKVNVYLGVPNKDEDLKMYQESKKLHLLLSNHKNINLIYDYIPNEFHSTVIHQATYNGLKSIFSSNQ